MRTPLPSPLHPAPAERDARYGYPTSESMGRDQVRHPEELSTLTLVDLGVSISVQDLRRVLDGDRDPELVERLEAALELGLEYVDDTRNGIR